MPFSWNGTQQNEKQQNEKVKKKQSGNNLSARYKMYKRWHLTRLSDLSIFVYIWFH